MSIWTFILNLSDLNIHTTIKKNYIKIMPSSTPHQKICFYHLPTRGRAGIKLGDAWYVSNVSIIFDCSMLYYLLFWTLLGFIIHIYIIFGTNLLTGGPAQNCCFFCLFWGFAEQEYQTESKRNKTFGNVIFSPNMFQETWSVRNGSNEEGTRQGGAPTPLGAPSTLMGPSLLHRRTSSSYIYPRTPKRSDKEPKP